MTLSTLRLRHQLQTTNLYWTYLLLRQARYSVLSRIACFNLRSEESWSTKQGFWTSSPPSPLHNIASASHKNSTPTVTTLTLREVRLSSLKSTTSGLKSQVCEKVLVSAPVFEALSPIIGLSSTYG
jgi:hypothetical protein